MSSRPVTVEQQELFSMSPPQRPIAPEPELQVRVWRGRFEGAAVARWHLHSTSQKRALGFVDGTTGWLFLEQEAERAWVRELLQRERPEIPVIGPDAEELNRLVLKVHLHVAPTGPGLLMVLHHLQADGQPSPRKGRVRDELLVDLPDGRQVLRATRQVLVAELAIYDARRDELGLAYEPWRPHVVQLLRRLGAVGDDAPGRSTATYGRMTYLRRWWPEETVTQAVIDEADGATVAVRARVDAEHAAAADAAGECSVHPELLSMLPPLLHPLALDALRAAHGSRHVGRVYDATASWCSPQPGSYALHGAPSKYPWKPWRRGVLSWTEDELDWLAQLVRDHHGHFPTVACWRAQREQPDLHARAAAFVARQRYPKSTAYSTEDEQRLVTRHLLAHSARQEAERRHTWPTPLLNCALCSEAFDTRELAEQESPYKSGYLLQLGPPRWCPACLRAAWWAPDRRDLTSDEAAASVHFLTECIGGPPPYDWFRVPHPPDLPPTQRDLLVLARLVGPRPDDVDARSATAWWTWLHSVGVADAVQPTSRGVLCSARDGHPCRSLLEKAVDDHLSSFGIAHTLEPGWPYHPQWNPNGQRRADWRLADGRLVEAAGLTGKPDYDQKMAEKRQLARELGLELVVIGPADVDRLHELLPRRG